MYFIYMYAYMHIYREKDKFKYKVAPLYCEYTGREKEREIGRRELQ